MSVYKDPRTPYYVYEFQFKGDRYRGSTEKRSKREAQAVERAVKERARAEHRAGNMRASDLTLADACARYILEVGAEDQEVERQLARVLAFLGSGKRILDVTDDDMAKLVAWRRGHRRWDRDDMPLVSAATVNRTTVELLRRVFGRAREHWGVRFPNEPKWGKHKLQEPPERARELHASEREAMELAVRSDGYGDAVAFALATGFRLNEVATLKWSEVNWHSRKITKRGKGGKTITTAITAEVEAILAPLVGHHPEAVFTYKAKRTREGRVRGQRYPLTREGLKTAWRRARSRAGVSDLRFHDLRHDLGTRVQRASGNLKITQRVLNHSDIRSTLRYINVRDDEVTEALEAAQSPRTSPRKPMKSAS
ncbi:tyrosine-type recombinase/integrase [Methyloceanibacter caenitepidi]|uniref:Integrase n=1 Tax=Methyloceanibacter caenitepidi TaxID=1384459 RepID=A0A0A8K3G1_9HYPH|nr:tyrosine-type recombinase/integrase [Methyloceanibacter caenitepidi]BAQ17483.1 integrase [Methyloceanibacter caenitepidi]